jgi:hypothetical protein
VPVYPRKFIRVFFLYCIYLAEPATHIYSTHTRHIIFPLLWYTLHYESNPYKSNGL